MLPTQKSIRVLFLVAGEPVRGLAPSSRFRVYAYAPQLTADARLSFRISASLPAKYFYDRPFFKKHRALGAMAIPVGLALMFLTRIRDLVRTPFYDVVYIQKPLFPGRFYPLLELAFVKFTRHSIFDFDDAVFVYHHASDNARASWLYRLFEYKNSTARIISAVSCVVAGNEYLATYARQFNSRVRVVPTVVDTDHYTPAPETVAARTPLVIGWIGTSGNLAYLEELAPVIRRLQQDYQVGLSIVCNPLPRPPKLPGVTYRWTRWTTDGELEALRAFDIGIMPLRDGPWERGKCGFKLLQYMACAIPTVASRVGVNTTIVADGENGFLATDISEWEQKLRLLLEHEHLRKQFSITGRATVAQQYSLRSGYPLLAEAIIGAAQTGKPRASRK
jgi:glycosyltransferase involved in cell wall biosynthesis